MTLCLCCVFYISVVCFMFRWKTLCLCPHSKFRLCFLHLCCDFYRTISTCCSTCCMLFMLLSMLPLSLSSSSSLFLFFSFFDKFRNRCSCSFFSGNLERCSFFILLLCHRLARLHLLCHLGGVIQNPATQLGLRHTIHF